MDDRNALGVHHAEQAQGIAAVLQVAADRGGDRPIPDGPGPASQDTAERLALLFRTVAPVVGLCGRTPPCLGGTLGQLEHVGDAGVSRLLGPLLRRQQPFRVDLSLETVEERGGTRRRAGGPVGGGRPRGAGLTKVPQLPLSAAIRCWRRSRAEPGPGKTGYLARPSPLGRG